MFKSKTKSIFIVILSFTLVFLFPILSSTSQYELYPKNISLPYVLDGQKGAVDFIVYGELADYLSRVSRVIDYQENEKPLREDFKLKIINEENQRELLLPLVFKIQNLTSNKEDQVRIATSIVQNIPYGAVDKPIPFSGGKINYSLYPYEVLYYNQGICGEKSALLAFLLKEMGYNISIFYFQEENHEVVGIKCPVKNSFRKTGYCFVETSGPAIITDSYMTYVDGIRIKSEPEIIPISDGAALPADMQEYKDAKTLKNIRNRNLFALFSFWKFDGIVKKYGLEGEYNLL
jgi:hypothetical protein